MGFLGSCRYLPIDVPDVVSGHISSYLLEIQSPTPELGSMFATQNASNLLIPCQETERSGIMLHFQEVLKGDKYILWIWRFFAHFILLLRPA